MIWDIDIKWEEVRGIFIEKNIYILVWDVDIKW